MTNLSDGDKTKMAAARTLIGEKRYDEARSLLVGIDHPQAVDWIMRIDAMPAKPTEKPIAKPASDARALWGGLSLIAFVVAVGGVALAVSSNRYDSQVFGGVVGIIALLIAYFARRAAK